MHQLIISHLFDKSTTNIHFHEIAKKKTVIHDMKIWFSNSDFYAILANVFFFSMKFYQPIKQAMNSFKMQYQSNHFPALYHTSSCELVSRMNYFCFFFLFFLGPFLIRTNNGHLLPIKFTTIKICLSRT